MRLWKTWFGWGLLTFRRTAYPISMLWVTALSWLILTWREICWKGSISYEHWRDVLPWGTFICRHWQEPTKIQSALSIITGQTLLENSRKSSVWIVQFPLLRYSSGNGAVRQWQRDQGGKEEGAEDRYQDHRPILHQQVPLCARLYCTRLQWGAGSQEINQQLQVRPAGSRGSHARNANYMTDTMSFLPLNHLDIINIFRMRGYRGGCFRGWVVRRSSFSGRLLGRDRCGGSSISRCGRLLLSTPLGYGCNVSDGDLCHVIYRFSVWGRLLLFCLPEWLDGQQWLIVLLVFVLRFSFQSFFFLVKWRVARWVAPLHQGLVPFVGDIIAVMIHLISWSTALALPSISSHVQFDPVRC